MSSSVNGLDGQRTHTPQFWARSISGEGGDVLTYSVRGGAPQTALAVFGVALLIGGGWAAHWLLSGGGLTAAGLIFLLLVPGGVMLFGVHCLNIALWARNSYLLGKYAFSARSHSLFGGKRRDIPRQNVEAISQYYTPPKTVSKHAQGDWVTFVAYRSAETGKLDEYPLAGMMTREEARWLGSILPEWAGVPLKRGFSAELEEADPAELPDLESGSES